MAQYAVLRRFETRWLERSGRGAPYCLAPGTLMEADGRLAPAEDVYERLEEGETIHARTHEGGYKEIEAAAEREIGEEIVDIEVQGLPWTLSITEEHPVLVRREDNTTEWVLAGNIEEGDMVVEPRGPEHMRAKFGEYEFDGEPPEEVSEINAQMLTRVFTDLQDMRPPPEGSKHYMTDELSKDQLWRFNFALKMEGSASHYRTSRPVADLRRQLAEDGMPITLPGCPAVCLRPLVEEWGEVDEREREVRIHLTPDRFRHEWGSPERGEYDLYEPEASAEETCRRAAYTISKALSALAIPVTIRKKEEGFTVVVEGRSAKRFLFSQKERNQGTRASRKWSEQEPTYPTQKDYVRREVTSVSRRHHEGSVYAFEVKDDSSFVAAGIATHNSQVSTGEALLPGEGPATTAQHLGPDGAVSTEATVTMALTSTYDPVAYQTAMMPEQKISPGASVQLDLSRFITPTRSGGWSDIDLRIHQFGGPDLTVTGDGGGLITLSMAAAADPAATRRDIVALQLLDATNSLQTLPIATAFPVAHDGTTEEGSAMSVGGLSAGLVEGQRFDPSALCGEPTVAYFEERWEPRLTQAMGTFDPTDGGDQLSETGLAIPANASGIDAPAALAMMKGVDGVSVVTLMPGPAPHFGAVNWPEGATLARLERGERAWIDYTSDLLQPPGEPEAWSRVLDSGDNLYDASLIEPARELEYSAPVYFGGEWIDEDSYPEDAQIDLEAGLVRYRSGLTSPATGPAQPVVETLHAEGVEGAIELQWQVSASGQDVTGSVDITVDDGTTTFDAQGDGTKTFTELDPTLSYDFTIQGTTVTATPLRERPAVGVTAWTKADMSYTYRYDTGAAPDTFVDHFGTQHSSPSFPLEVTGSEVVREHSVELEWNSPSETKSFQVAADWQLPPDGTSFDAEVEVGRTLPATDVESPSFYRTRYTGAREITLTSDVYRPGRWRIEPVGYLPLGLDGELEDHVRAWFVGPTGEAFGAEVSFEQPTELKAKMEVQASDGQSPVVVGARINWNEVS